MGLKEREGQTLVKLNKQAYSLNYGQYNEEVKRARRTKKSRTSWCKEEFPKEMTLKKRPE
jgi:hypothetical protein